MTTPDAPAWLRPAIGLPMPDACASHGDWSSYALARGMPADLAASLGRDQIMLEFVPIEALRNAAPRIERLDRDPATRAAVREGRR